MVRKLDFRNLYTIYTLQFLDYSHNFFFKKQCSMLVSSQVIYKRKKFVLLLMEDIAAIQVGNRIPISN